MAKEREDKAGDLSLSLFFEVTFTEGKALVWLYLYMYLCSGRFGMLTLRITELYCNLPQESSGSNEATLA